MQTVSMAAGGQVEVEKTGSNESDYAELENKHAVKIPPAGSNQQLEVS
jgi:hypothetical protein